MFASPDLHISNFSRTVCESRIFWYHIAACRKYGVTLLEFVCTQNKENSLTAFLYDQMTSKSIQEQNIIETVVLLCENQWL